MEDQLLIIADAIQIEETLFFRQFKEVLSHPAVKQNQAHFKYRFYTVSNIRISLKKTFNSDIIFQNLFGF